MKHVKKENMLIYFNKHCGYFLDKNIFRFISIKSCVCSIVVFLIILFQYM